MLATKEEFLSSKECDFIVSYYKKQKKTIPYFKTIYIRLQDIPFYHFRMKRLLKKYIRNIKKNFPFLKLTYGQIVLWENNSSRIMHKDTDIPLCNSTGTGIVDWTSVCYLNDDFKGGETLIEDKAFKPKKGSLLAFNSKQLLHGVNNTSGNRYTFILWWEEIKNACV